MLIYQPPQDHHGGIKLLDGCAYGLGKYTAEEYLLDSIANEITKEIDKEIVNTLTSMHPSPISDEAD